MFSIVGDAAFTEAVTVTAAVNSTVTVVSVTVGHYSSAAATVTVLTVTAIYLTATAAVTLL